MEREFKNTDFFIEDIDESVKDLAVNDTSVTHVPANTDFFIENIDNNVMEIAIDRGLTPDVVNVVPANTDFFIINIDSNVIKIATNLGITPTTVTNVPANTDFFIENIYYNLILICEELNIEPFEITRSPINTDFFIEAIATNVQKIMDAQTEKHVNGSFINITLSADSEITEYELDGNATQNGTPTPDAPVAVNTVTGEQVVKVTGKNLWNGEFGQGQVSGASIIRITSTQSPFIHQSQPYTISIGNLPEGYRYAVALYTKPAYPYSQPGTAFFDSGWKTDASFTFTPNSDAYFSVVMSKTDNSSLTPTDVEGCNFQLEFGSTSTSYEVFTSQTQEVNLGKNLLAPASDFTLTRNGITFSGVDGIYTLTGTATANTNSDNYSVAGYTIQSGDYLHIGNDTIQYSVAFVLNFTDSTKADPTLSAVNRIFDLSAFVGKTISSIRFYVGNGVDVGTTTISPMIVKSNTATDYAPYFTPIELAKIGTYQDRIYKSGGKWYVEKQVGKHQLAQSDGWFQASEVFYTANITDFAPSDNIPICNMASGVENVSGASAMQQKPDNTCAFFNQPASVQARLYMHLTGFANVTALVNYFASNPTTVYYALATPTTTEITDETLIEQLEAVYDFELKEGVVNIVLTATSPNLPAILKTTIKPIE